MNYNGVIKLVYESHKKVHYVMNVVTLSEYTNKSDESCFRKNKRYLLVLLVLLLKY